MSNPTQINGIKKPRDIKRMIKMTILNPRFKGRLANTKQLFGKRKGKDLKAKLTNLKTNFTNQKLPKISQGASKLTKDKKKSTARKLKPLNLKKDMLMNCKIISQKKPFSPAKALSPLRTNSPARASRRRNHKNMLSARNDDIFPFGKDKRVLSQDKKQAVPTMLSKEEISQCEIIHQEMMTKVEQQIAKAKETRFRFLSPGKLMKKLQRSIDRSLIMSLEREIKAPNPQNVAHSTVLNNPLLNESNNCEPNCTDSLGEEQDLLILKKIGSKKKSSRNRRNLQANQFFRSL
ncbi:unnamed protein product [Moneuplotes crassus]|uniref:Uncharacterized protein n=1 Tax=Euplotes crassus TaxID=5936 RepID=A0AAD2DBQ3_EUPCR|nr:unnamed protein product [Moneuplotes crassus]